MKCYHVTFHCLSDSGGVDFTCSFYADCLADLAEQILEYEEDLEDYIIISKKIKEIKC